MPLEPEIDCNVEPIGWRVRVDLVIPVRGQYERVPWLEHRGKHLRPAKAQTRVRHRLRWPNVFAGHRSCRGALPARL